jgi:hypothetical protein
MLFGFPTKIGDLIATVVVAATVKQEMDDFLARLKANPNNILMTGFAQATLLDLLANPMFAGYKAFPIKITHHNEKERLAFLAEFNIKQVNETETIDLQLAMTNPAIEGTIVETEEEPEDNRTIAEIYGLTEDDPWSDTNEEDKAAKEAYDKAVKEGKLSGPFRGSTGERIVIHDVRHPEKNDIHVTAVKFPEKILTPEEQEKKDLIDIAGQLTPQESKELAVAVIYGSFTKEDYANKLKEYAEKRKEKAAKETPDEIKVEIAVPDTSPISDEKPEEKEVENENGTTSRPYDYYFTIFTDPDDGIFAAITPIKYFAKNQCMYDQHLTGVVKGLENWFEIAEATFESPFDSAKNSYNDLRRKGFIDSTEFSRSMAASGVDIYAA